MKTCYQRLAAIVAATVLIGFSAQMIGYAESDVVTIPRSKILTSEDSGVMESDMVDFILPLKAIVLLRFPLPSIPQKMGKMGMFTTLQKIRYCFQLKMAALLPI